MKQLTIVIYIYIYIWFVVAPYTLLNILFVYLNNTPVVGESHVGMPPFRTPTNLDDMASHLDDLSTNKIYISRHISQSLSPLATRHTQMWVEIHLQVTFICSHRAHDYMNQQLRRDRYFYSPSAPFMHIFHQLFFFKNLSFFIVGIISSYGYTPLDTQPPMAEVDIVKCVHIACHAYDLTIHNEDKCEKCYTS